MGTIRYALLINVIYVLVFCDSNVVKEGEKILPLFKYEGKSHYDFGYKLASQFREKINLRIRNDSPLNSVLIPFYRTPQGMEMYKRFHQSHSTYFQDYMDELRGIANGAKIPFHVIFLLNIKEEYNAAITSLQNKNLTLFKPTLKCSDMILYSSQVCIVAHNEDSGFSDVNHSALVLAKIGGTDALWFTAFTYLGDLPTGGFGYNSNGIAFTLNFVQPRDIEIGGLGRGFISRHLLDAKNLENAIEIITIGGQSAGHNYQLMDIKSKRIFNIEVASFSRYSIHEVLEGDAPLFHANQYQFLHLSQPPYQSSIHRLRTYKQMNPPKSLSDILQILGDQSDLSYPVYHDKLSHARGELSGWTLFSIYFDLNVKEAVLLHQNPKERHVLMTWNLLNPLDVKYIQ